MSRDDRDIWFPAKRYGWGWGPPATWQGWVTVACYVGMLGLGFLAIDPETQEPLFLAWILGWTAAFLLVGWLKGERPRWRWGGRD